MNNKFTKAVQIVVILVFMMFFLMSLYNFVLNKFFIETVLTKDGIINEGHSTKAFFYREENLVTAENSGVFEANVAEGERISRLYKIGELSNKPIYSKESGIVSFDLDGLEKVQNPLNNANLSFEDLESKYNLQNTSHKKEYVKNEPILKIINNLQSENVYMRIPLNLFEEPLKEGKRFNLQVDRIGEKISARIINLKGVANQALVELKLDENIMSKLNLRLEKVKVVLKENKGTLIPLEALVKNSKGEDGVYIVKKNFVNFQKMNIIARDDKNFLVDDIQPLTEVVITPGYIKEGKYLN